MLATEAVSAQSHAEAEIAAAAEELQAIERRLGELQAERAKRARARDEAQDSIALELVDGAKASATSRHLEAAERELGVANRAIEVLLRRKAETQDRLTGAQAAVNEARKLDIDAELDDLVPAFLEAAETVLRLGSRIRNLGDELGIMDTQYCRALDAHSHRGGPKPLRRAPLRNITMGGFNVSEWRQHLDRWRAAQRDTAEQYARLTAEREAAARAATKAPGILAAAQLMVTRAPAGWKGA